MPDAITAISLVALGTSLPRARKQKDSFETFEGKNVLWKVSFLSRNLNGCHNLRPDTFASKTAAEQDETLVQNREILENLQSLCSHCMSLWQEDIQGTCVQRLHV